MPQSLGDCKACGYWRMIGRQTYFFKRQLSQDPIQSCKVLQSLRPPLQLLLRTDFTEPQFYYLKFKIRDNLLDVIADTLQFRSVNKCFLYDNSANYTSMNSLEKYVVFILIELFLVKMSN